VIAREDDFRFIQRFAMSVAELRKNGMMAHLMDALSQGEDIGHYGRLVFVMVESITEYHEEKAEAQS